ncbi:hypothetical protein Y032_0242g3460 [Ancylostoma ceylanicum]|uniref:Transthyretin-like family protein n=1 Tax=Ancylostoma ceylanicum TaxID=53326 RepID=A0A016SEQ6_9BILA|nr:hypothetical protein Y032_0242g3460 [Ancylostoma ceylanicum]
MLLFLLAAVTLSTASVLGIQKLHVECEKPEEFPKELYDSFIVELNNRRRRMVDGKQKNGKYSVPPNLPKGENVLEMVSCETFGAFQPLLFKEIVLVCHDFGLFFSS